MNRSSFPFAFCSSFPSLCGRLLFVRAQHTSRWSWTRAWLDKSCHGKSQSRLTETSVLRIVRRGEMCFCQLLYLFLIIFVLCDEFLIWHDEFFSFTLNILRPSKKLLLYLHIRTRSKSSFSPQPNAKGIYTHTDTHTSVFHGPLFSSSEWLARVGLRSLLIPRIGNCFESTARNLKVLISALLAKL